MPLGTNQAWLAVCTELAKKWFISDSVEISIDVDSTSDEPTTTGIEFLVVIL